MLRVWDQNGNLIVGPNTAVGSILGTVDTGGVNGSVSDSRFGQGIPRVFYALPINDGTSNSLYGLPKFTVNGNTLSWTYKVGAYYKPNIKILYGIS